MFSIFKERSYPRAETFSTPASLFCYQRTNKWRNVVAMLAVICGLGATNVLAATYYSQTSGNPATLANWNTVRGGGGSTPAGDAKFPIFGRLSEYPNVTRTLD